MVWWWWVIPGVAALLGASILFRGLGALFGGRLFAGVFGAASGGAVLAAAVAVVLLGMNVQTYHRLTYERPVATLSVTQKGPQLYEATLTQPPLEEGGAEITAVYPLHGDEWRIEAQVLKWKPRYNVIGLDTQYRLDRLSGRYRSVQQELTAERSAYDLSGGDVATRQPWDLQVWDVARQYRRYVDAVDTLYGGGAFMPMADGGEYEVTITQSGLIARPTNDIARNASAGGFVEVN